MLLFHKILQLAFQCERLSKNRMKKNLRNILAFIERSQIVFIEALINLKVNQVRLFHGKVSLKQGSKKYLIFLFYTS